MATKKTFLFCFLTVLLFSVLFCFACDKKEVETESEKSEQTAEKVPSVEYTFGFIGDIHLLSEESIGNDDYDSFLDYKYVGQRILPLSEAILKSAVDNYIEKR